MTKQTFLHDKHIELHAKMVDFAGWHMPVQYSSIIEEHKTVRENVGLFDVSHMGELIVQGEDACPYLNKIVPQDITKLVARKAVYCQLTNKHAGIIDDLIIYKIENKKYLVIVNAARIDEDLNWMVRNQRGFNVEIINESHNYSLLAVQGPKAKELMYKMGVETLPPFFTIKRGELCNVNVWISRTGYTGEDGVEILVKNDFSELLWDKILEYGKEFGIKPIGLGARDTLRLEAALHLYGNDLDEETTPIEAGLSWSIPKDKIDDYNGRSTIEAQLKNGVDKKLIGLVMIDRGIARHGYDVYYKNERIGTITSGGISPIRNENIALAYVKALPEIKTDTNIQVEIRGKLYNAKVVKRPFVKKNNKG